MFLLWYCGWYDCYFIMSDFLHKFLTDHSEKKTNIFGYIISDVTRAFDAVGSFISVSLVTQYCVST